MVPYRKVLEGLTAKSIRYLVAGGFAVNFHQVQRATVDLDLVVQIERENLLRFIGLMKDLGFKPRLPVNPEDFAEDSIRQDWIQKKGMMVFSFIHQKNPFEVIDIFAEEPKPFDELWGARLEVSAFGLKIPVIGKTDLIEMKQKANREKDRFDIAELKKT